MAEKFTEYDALLIKNGKVCNNLDNVSAHYVLKIISNSKAP